MVEAMHTVKQQVVPLKQYCQDRCPKALSWLRQRRLAAWQLKANFVLAVSRPTLDWPRQILTPPARITRGGVNWAEDRALVKATGRVVSGDWDLKVAPVARLDEYAAWQARLSGDTRNDTRAAYRPLLADLDNAALGQPSPIVVRVGRDGQLLLAGGQAHLAIARQMNLPSIPVQITWWHHDWAQFRVQLLDYAQQWGGKLYQPLLHPTLSDIPVEHDDSRFEIIRANLPSMPGGTVLDIGANLGYFCHRLEDAGFFCYGVERSYECFYLMNRLRIAEQKRFAAVHADIFEFWEKSEFDVVLALNVFHHFLKTAAEFEDLKQFLGRIRTQVMFFESHLPDEPQMRNAYRNFGPEEFVAFVAEQTGLVHWTVIGCGKEGRPIYKLTKV